MKTFAFVSLVVLHLFTATSAIIGGALLVRHPEGQDWLPLSILAPTPFHSFTIPGHLLIWAVGGSAALAAAVLLLRRRFAPWVSGIASAILSGWIVIEAILLRRFEPLHALYLTIGVVGLSLAAFLFVRREQTATVTSSRRAATNP